MSVLGYERVRAVTLRSTFVFPFIGAAIAWAAATAFLLLGGTSAEATFADYVSQAYSPLSTLFITIPFAQAFGHEYRDGTMRLTLSAFPHRTRVFLAKILVPGIFAVIWTALCLGVIAALCYSKEIPGLADAPMVTLRCSGYTLFWGLLVAAITAITRNLAAGVAGVLVWGLIIEQLLGQLLVSRIPAIPSYLPLLQGMLWLRTGELRPGLVITATTAAFVTFAWLKFVRQDA